MTPNTIKPSGQVETILGYPIEEIMARQQGTYVGAKVVIVPGRITPSQYEKNEWSRMATDAYSKGLNDIGHKFSMAATLRNKEDCSLAWFDALQAEYRAWLVDGFKQTIPVTAKETLLYRQGFDLHWRLRDARGFQLGVFDSPAFIKQWCDDNGYGCRQG